MNDRTRHSFDVYYLHTLVKYFKVSSDVFNLKTDDFYFDENGALALNGETFAPERETLVKRETPYALQWQVAWFDIVPKRDDEEPPTSVKFDKERFAKDCEEVGRPRVFHVVTHHHVAVTKRGSVTEDTESGRTALSIIADYPNVESLEFDFEDDRVKIAFENHDAPSMRCPLEEIARTTKKEPHAVYLGDGKLIREDESWTACQQLIKVLKKQVDELHMHIDLMEERHKCRRIS